MERTAVLTLWLTSDAIKDAISKRHKVGSPNQDRDGRDQCRTVQPRRRSSEFPCARSQQDHSSTRFLACWCWVATRNTLAHGSCGAYEWGLRETRHSRLGCRDKDAFNNQFHIPFYRTGFSECGLCSHQEELFGAAEFQVSEVAWASACGGVDRGTVAPGPHQNPHRATNTHRNRALSAPRCP